ncbi:MAG: acetolactate synthase small subunit [Magnetococcales bacterium]|nr:acetolactate synthase small subunit [Magnetococcales bacterium]
MKHIISVLVDNEAGVLSRVAGLFSARGFNIETLTVAPVGEGNESRMTIVTTGDESIVEQVTKQLHKLVPVIRVVDLTEGPHVSRELMLVKVAAEGEHRSEVLRIADIFRCRVVDATAGSFIIEVTGGSEKLDACLDLLRPLGLVEVVRTGRVAISRGARETGVAARTGSKTTGA